MISKKELALNCQRWADTIKRQMQKDKVEGEVGFVLTFFPKGSQGTAVIMGNVPERRLKGIFEDVLKRFSEQLIIKPGDLLS